jgi:uncharacterized protein YjbJ (UPF0337 family)
MSRACLTLQPAGARAPNDRKKRLRRKVKGRINEGVSKMTDDPAQEAKG